STASAAGGRWSWALLLLKEARDWGPRPNAVTYNSAAAACIRARRWSMAASISEEMCVRQTRPSVVTLNSLVASSPDWRRSLHLCRVSARLMSIEADMVTFNSAISSCSSGEGT
ncbi:unnamed protein product, partial [Polarella glacialis]